MNDKTRFILRFIGSLLLATLAAVCISYDFVSFSLVFLIAAYAFCPVRSIKPQPRSRNYGRHPNP